MGKYGNSREQPAHGRKYELYVTVGAVAVVLVAAIWLAVSTHRPEVAGDSRETGSSSGINSQINHLKQEINDLQSILSSQPADKESLVTLANNQYDLGSIYLFDLQQKEEGTEWFNRAVESYQKVLDLDPENIAARVDMATAAFYAGREALAKSSFEQAVSQAPTYANARINYGVFLADAKEDYKGAIAQWERVLEMNVDQDTINHVQSLIKEAEDIMASQE
ncbi:MAG: hypothetical protein AB1500_03520 [Bacillota bacterium]